ncbi:MULTISPECIES: hypothetical protein [unclassified Streptomyces]|uniref:DUF7507 domain-containing protein n=1 Tax=unclassified Streptomyces TaxID=2593676 RepID=UPI0012FEA8E6|nr:MULTISPECIES: hypothetical protein [unclassified Streptomyces]
MRGGLLVVVALTGVVLPGAALPGAVPPGSAAWAGGVGDGALTVAVTVNGRDHSGVRPPELRTGGQVVKRYRLVNRGEAHLYGVRVADPEVPSGAVRCPGGPLAALGELECVARFRAVSGTHRGTVRAEGSVPSLRRVLTATARAGYTGVAGALRLTERIAVAPPGRGAATVTYTVTNHGNRPLHAVLVGDTALGLRAGAVDCAGHPGTVPLLAPGASARCTATVRRPPGTHRSTGLASGSDRVTTYGPGGGRVPPPTLVARSSAVFTVAGPEARGAARPPGRPSAAAGREPVGNPVRNPAGGPVRGSAGAAGVPGVPGAPGALGAPGAPVAGGGVPVPGAAGAVAVPGPVAPPGAAPGDGAADGGGAGTGAGAGDSAGAGDAAAVAPAPEGVPPGAVPPAPTAPDAVPVPRDEAAVAARRAATLDHEGFLGRLRRRSREADDLGVVSMLLLLLIPAAVAAALLGNRRS